MKDWSRGQYTGGHTSWRPSHPGPHFCTAIRSLLTFTHPTFPFRPSFRIPVSHSFASSSEEWWVRNAGLAEMSSGKNDVLLHKHCFCLVQFTKDLRKVICLRNNRASLADKKGAFYLQDMFRLTAYFLL